MDVTAATIPTTKTHAPTAAELAERDRARRYPLARWYLRPAAAWLAERLVHTRMRPVALTLCGLVSATAAGAVLLTRPEALPLAALLVLLYWFFDRADGLLARRQKTASAWGAWLDGNIDELVDVGLHAALAAALAANAASSWPWILLAAFLGGKYLFAYGLTLEEHAAEASTQVNANQDPQSSAGLLARLYHLPGNADIRVHLLAAAILTGWLGVELALVAVYYNMRWIVRYVLVARRLHHDPGSQPQ